MENHIKRTYFIDQPRFLGDTIYVMAIAQHYANKGCKIIFPIEGDEKHIKDMQYAFPTVNIVSVNDVKEYENYYATNKIDDKYHVIPCILNSMKASFTTQMKNKYTGNGFDFNMWREIKIIRNLKKEKELINKLNIKENEKFSLINENYRSNIPSKVAKTKVNKISISNINVGNRKIFLKFIEGYSLLDWIGVIERANKIYTVHTSIHYLIELFSTTKEVHIFKRGDENHNRYDFLFKKEYIYH